MTQFSRRFNMMVVSCLALALAFVAGCGEDEVADDCTGTDCPPVYLAQTSPTNVTRNLITAYRYRNIEQYAKLLAIDFQFYFDEETRPSGIPIFWTRLEDSTGTGNLFRASDVTDIRIDLTYGADVPVVQVGRESWRRITITDTFLEIDMPPAGGGEVLTLRVDGDQQDYYFRKGRTPADTLASSPTAAIWYLVEWRDLGRTFAAGVQVGAADESVSWGGIKAQFR